MRGIKRVKKVDDLLLSQFGQPISGHFRIADHPERGQTSQYKRVYLYRSALGAKIILDECIGLIAPIEREAGPIEPNKNSPRRNSVP